MKKVLISGLNTYLGRRASCYLQTKDFHVTGLVRNLSIFNKIVKEKVTAKLFELDLLRKGPAYDNFQISDLNFGIYFTQVPSLDNDIQLQLELLGLRNFVEICKRSGNDRVIYVARLMDEHFLDPVRNLLEALRVQYTIVVKSSVIGKESVLNRIFGKLAKKQTIFYWNWVASLKFHPLPLLDVYRWLREMPWENNFISEVIYLGGHEEVTFRSLFYQFLSSTSSSQKREIGVNKFFAKLLLSRFNDINKEDIDEFRRVLYYEKNVDNSTWQKVQTFEFTPLKAYVSMDT
ncbi:MULTISPECIES: NAD(P)-dependent oxidoreductase [Sphingobacterium]|uniref:NAD(P)-dependent oxidoreductase n=1 Tax=Sphingobacterium athyrii TaxID=2152717 RepID=A0A363NKZ2_9SPHI|nr:MULTISPECIES: NAD(P)-dependent oxidoreductase [Sphingobacterium]PUV21488.1 hypothetical protein DCO56_27175 [Sphingobacterium athyrii]QIH36055.1 NAD(P)-dependent oxidoreductase [Sphingobacterium sp. DR205]